MPTVELHDAFFWYCEDCGRENFARAVALDPRTLSPDNLPPGMDAEAMAEWRDVAAAEGVFLLALDRVTCSHCGATFDAEPAGAG